MSFFLGSGRRRRPPPSGISMLGAAKPPLRQGFLLRRKRLCGALAPRPRRAVGWFSYTFSRFQNIDFNRPFQNKRQLRKQLPFVFLLCGKNKGGCRRPCFYDSTGTSPSRGKVCPKMVIEAISAGSMMRSGKKRKRPWSLLQPHSEPICSPSRLLNIGPDRKSVV